MANNIMNFMTLPLHSERALSVAEGDVEFAQRLLAFLDDTISNSIPPDPAPDLEVPSGTHHPCPVRGIPADGSPENDVKRQKDMHYLASKCQQHEHSKTCFKYWRGPPEPKTCRFDLHEDNARPVSTFAVLLHASALHIPCVALASVAKFHPGDEDPVVRLQLFCL
ncbi:hypothetical protein R3P38DRAFT_3167904 [Favolaschia claudopus]|uniref:Uncharacterized protein n=1 Tax=Favolaschia claudopus TaxID=2862362 RepID=A0AAW0E4X4_9AGAR